MQKFGILVENERKVEKLAAQHSFRLLCALAQFAAAHSRSRKLCDRLIDCLGGIRGKAGKAALALRQNRGDRRNGALFGEHAPLIRKKPRKRRDFSEEGRAALFENCPLGKQSQRILAKDKRLFPARLRLNNTPRKRRKRVVKRRCPDDVRHALPSFCIFSFIIPYFS